MQNTETTFRKNNEWSVIDGEPCRVVSFNTIASIENGKVLSPNKTESYALIVLECKKKRGKIKGFVHHKTDFEHLWAAFKERGIKDNEEVIIFYSKKYYKTYAKVFSAFMPRLWVMICHKGVFELITNPNASPELTGEARAKAELPIIEWKPKIMK